MKRINLYGKVLIIPKVGTIWFPAKPYELEGEFIAGENILFCNGHENYRYLSFSKILKGYYLHLGGPAYLENIDILVDLIRQLKIGTFVTSCHLPRGISLRGYDMFDILGKLGVRCFLIDNDFFDQGYDHPFMRVTLNDVECRFSTWGILNKHWDRIFEIGNVKYTPILQNYNEGSTRPGKKIIICSHLRLQKEPIPDFQNRGWASFLAERERLIESDLSYQVKTIAIINLFMEFNRDIEAHKVTIVDWIQDKQNLEIYGNEEWGRFFPENYRGWLDEKALLEKLHEDNIFVLPNSSATYMDAFGPLFDMVRFGKKFLHPKVASGNLPMFEFSNSEELNDKLRDLPDQECAMSQLKMGYQHIVDECAKRIMAT